MSKVWVTNESSSFAKSFATWCNQTGKHNFVNSLENDEYDYFRQDNLFRSKEIDIFDPTLSNMIGRSSAELIIHQLPITPERSTTNKDYAIRNNIEGTYYVIDTAKEVGIPILFITSKNYNNITNNITNNTNIPDIYNITAQAVENLLDVLDIKHTSIIPPIIYGPEFDEGISGLIKTAINNKEQVVINLDPEVQHPFMHVDDFFNALSIVVENLKLDIGGVDKSVIEVHPHPESYSSIDTILQQLEEHGFFLSYDIHPEKDVFENIAIVENNITTLYGWEQKFTIKDGLEDVINKLREKHDDDKRTK